MPGMRCRWQQIRSLPGLGAAHTEGSTHSPATGHPGAQPRGAATPPGRGCAPGAGVLEQRLGPECSHPLPAQGAELLPGKGHGHPAQEAAREGTAWLKNAAFWKMFFSNFLHYLFDTIQGKIQTKKTAPTAISTDRYQNSVSNSLCFKMQNHPLPSLPSFPTKLSSFGLSLCFSTRQILVWEPHGASAEQ